MAITETIQKRRLVVVLGENEIPASWHWECMRFLRNDDGTDAAPPQAVSMAATAEEAAAHLGQGVVDLQAASNTLTARVAELTAERDAALAAAAAAKAAAQAVADADASWDASVRPLVTQVLVG